MEKYLIVGLGNPGIEYENTKHNVGFKCIDALCSELKIKLETNKFQGIYNVYNFDDKQFFISKPLTYMNNSGIFVNEISKFYKIDKKNIVVIYDDIDTEIGKIRVKLKGSSGGQNGMKNIISLMGSEDIKRIRIGIGKPKYDLAKYVLSKFEIQDLVNIQMAINNAKNAIISFINGNSFEKIMNNFN